MIGNVISHYKILSKLGEGGMGQVYKAQDSRLDRPVALKFLSGRLIDQGDRERFIREAKAASALDHPNICTIYEVGEAQDGRLFIAMAYYDGSTLQEAIGARRLTYEDALGYALQIAEGLQAAHERGIVHRDIKSGNIMITSKAQVKIMDFGLAKTSGVPGTTEAGLTLGTAAYMSPEQILGAEIDQRTDLWSLGVVMYEMLAGELPFRAEHLAAFAYAIVHTDAPALRLNDGRTAKAIAELVHDLLQREKEHRIPSADVVVRRLRAIKGRPDPGEAMPAGARQKSIAVLPFANLSPDPENEFFTAGITDEITGSLSRLKKLKVCSRSMALQYKGKLIDPRIVGKELGAEVILEGSVRRIGQRVRLAVGLTETQTGFQLWAQSYDRQIEDVFALQDEISRTIVQALELELTSADRSELMQKYRANVQAYDEYLRGRFLWNKRQEEPVRLAIKHFRNAIEIDPDYTLAYADLATCYSVLSNYAWMDPKEAFRLGNEALQKAIALEPDFDEVQVTWAQYCYVQCDLYQAMLHYERALQLNPSHVTAHHWLAYMHLASGDFGNALRENREALHLEPLSLIINAYLGFIHFCMGNHDPALKAIDRAVGLDGSFSAGHHLRAWVLAWMGRFDEAVRSVEDGAKAWGEHRQLLVVRAVIEARRGNNAGASLFLGRLLQIEQSGSYVHPFDAACIHAAMGEREKMFEALERAAEVKFYWWFALLNVHPLFEPYRSDPRFRAIVNKLGLRKTGA